MVSSESLAFSTERLSESFSEDSSLIFSNSNIVVFSWNTVSPVLSVLDLFNDSFSIDYSTLSLDLAPDVSEDLEATS